MRAESPKQSRAVVPMAIVHHANQYLITNVYGNNSSCNGQSAVSSQPDFAGNFAYNIGNGSSINIERDIVATTDVQPVINGFKARGSRVAGEGHLHRRWLAGENQ